jgi:multicomponent K+:H+ antiporter subunit E
MAAATTEQQRRWLAHPFISAMLAAGWLMLQESLALPQLITAAVLALVVPRLIAGFLGPRVIVGSWVAVLRFIPVVLWDIVVSNIAVAKLVLSTSRQPEPAWVRVPLDLRNPNGIALLATVITTTPGTVSCIIDEPGHEILVHALDCSDPAAMARDIKMRYERPLMEIFG